MTDFWWGAIAFAPPAFIAGIATTLTASAILIQRRPMEGARYTGDRSDSD